MTGRLAVLLATIFFFWLAPVPAYGGQPVEGSPAPVVRDSGDTAADSIATRTTTNAVKLTRSRISVWAAGSVRPGGILGRLRNGWFGLVGLRYHRLLIPDEKHELATHEAATLTYTADLVPLARVTIPEGTPPAARALRIRSVAERGFQTMGIGMYPLGLRVGFRPSSRLQPFVAGHTGLFHLFDALPDERGRHLNFAVGLGIGVEISLPRHTTLTLGYRYHHLSNGFRGRINPGLDANLLYVGLGAAP